MSFSEKTVDDKIAADPDLPIEEQPDAWGELDKTINQEYYPNVNIGYYNNLQAYGESDRQLHLRHGSGLPEPA